jgi:Flp pilus assembly protein TadG
MRQFRDSAGRRVGGFIRDRRGNFAVMFGAVVTVLAVAVGFGVDTVQLFNAKAALRAAVDAAITSTARDLTTGVIKPADANRMVNAFLSANGNGGILSANGVALDSLVVNQTAKTVEATAHVDVALFFPLFGMDKTQRVTNTSAAVYSDKNIEVAMILDVTGSMAGQKIEDLKKAAAIGVDAFLDGQNPDKPRVRVAIVPYANSVNAGKLAARSVFVETKASQRSTAPGNDDPQLVSGGQTRPDNCATERKGAYQYSDAGPDVSMVNRDLLLSGFAQQTRTSACPAAAVVPLTADVDALKTEIDHFAASGGTAGHIGIQWGWYMLSRNWSGVMAASEQPAATNRKKVAKVAILMTDGEFNLSYFDADSVGQVYNDAGKIQTRQAASKLCAAMREQGIEIFTIGFDLNEKNAKATLQDCASKAPQKVQHFYEAADGEELAKAFRKIALNVESLYLTR